MTASANTPPTRGDGATSHLEAMLSESATRNMEGNAFRGLAAALLVHETLEREKSSGTRSGVDTIGRNLTLLYGEAGRFMWRELHPGSRFSPQQFEIPVDLSSPVDVGWLYAGLAAAQRHVPVANWPTASEFLIVAAALDPWLVRILPWVEQPLPSDLTATIDAFESRGHRWATPGAAARAIAEWPSRLAEYEARLAEAGKPLPLGQSDFESVRRNGCAYVDKSDFIASLLADDNLVVLFPAPRRFGKSLTLSMLRAFFDHHIEEREREFLFDGLAIKQMSDAWDQRGNFAVLHLSLKDTESSTAEEFRGALAVQLARTARNLLGQLDRSALSEVENGQLQRLLDEVPTSIDLRFALERLVRWLGQATGRKVVVLIDEYDAPVHRVGEKDRETVLDLLRNLFSAGLKDNPYLHKGVLTGVLRIGKESMFSGLNHVAVHTMLTAKYSTAFGFDEFEVAMLAKARGVLHRFADFEDWYDGFMSGTRRVFNPWSVLSALNHLVATPDQRLGPFWANTGDPKRLLSLIERHAAANGPVLERLLSGDRVSLPLSESVAFSELDTSPEATWTFLVYTGYLTAELEGPEKAIFRIPNWEAKGELTRLSREWLSARIGGEKRVATLLAALIGGDESAFQAALEQIFLTHASVHDVARSPENGYHMFVLGLLVALEGRYVVRSNREAGFGRYDILMAPARPGDPGIVIEFKAISGKSLPASRLKSELEGAIQQIEDRRYADELWTSGAKLVRAIAVVGNGKRIACRFKTLSEQGTQPL